ncbi:hypothetical protein TNCV_4810071 [Trichonephila clavipes]|uniref:Uncharacterized protein n=1 Tax=Trichonephila clavipes TaxID=2585209 RepID=A0A8X6VAJ2_TRICX|nr:hypothetical protein TNCV_4810071 [Trichonephila clavipes]
MVELVKGISKLPDRRLEADRPRHSIQFINDQRQSLVDPKKILFAPLHIKLGLMKQFVKALDKEGECFKTERTDIKTLQWCGYKACGCDWLVHRAFTPPVRGSNSGLGKIAANEQEPMDWEDVPFLPQESAPFVPSRPPRKMRYFIFVQASEPPSLSANSFPNMRALVPKVQKERKFFKQFVRGLCLSGFESHPHRLYSARSFRDVPFFFERHLKSRKRRDEAANTQIYAKSSATCMNSSVRVFEISVEREILQTTPGKFFLNTHCKCDSGKLLGEPPPLAPNRKKRQAKTKWRQANPTTVTTTFDDSRIQRAAEKPSGKSILKVSRSAAICGDKF